MKFKNIIILFLFIIIWLCKPIPYNYRNRFVEQEILISRGGGQDPIETTFVYPKIDPKLSLSEQIRELKFQKVQKVQQTDNTGQKLTYKQPANPGGSSLGGGNINEDLPKMSDLDKTISDVEFWDSVQNEDLEEELNQAPSSPPTFKLTKKYIEENNFLKKPPEPFHFKDWEGKKRSIYGKPLKKGVFSHGIEAGTSSLLEDLAECPIQNDPMKHQRKDCSILTDKTVGNFSKKIVETATSKRIGMIKFETKMPYYDTEIAIAHMDLLTGDCMFFHKNGKFWGYKKYTIKETTQLLADVSSSLKWASNHSSPGSEL